MAEEKELFQPHGPSPPPPAAPAGPRPCGRRRPSAARGRPPPGDRATRTWCIALAHVGLGQAVELPQAAASPVADHGAPQLGAHRHPQAVVAQAVGAAVDHQKGRYRRAALGVHPAELVILFDGDPLLHGFSSHLSPPADLRRPGKFSPGKRPRDGKTLRRPFRNLSIRDANSRPQWVRRARPLARRRARTLRPLAVSIRLRKSMLLGALALLGLVGTEHLHTPPNLICRAARKHRATRRRFDGRPLKARS